MPADTSHSRQTVALPRTLGYSRFMDEHQDAGYYKTLIDSAESYHDLVVFRSRFFGLLESTLSKQDCQEVKDHSQVKAKDESLPIAPPSKA